MNAPEIDSNLVKKKFRIEMSFSQPGESGERLLDCYHGTVTDIMNKNISSVKIKWDNDCLYDDDMKFSTYVLLISIWNQKILVEGLWREYLRS